MKAVTPQPHAIHVTRQAKHSRGLSTWTVKDSSDGGGVFASIPLHLRTSERTAFHEAQMVSCVAIESKNHQEMEIWRSS
jgi:hypothetical protein